MQNLSEPEPKLKQKERVALVIDDSPSVRDILKLHLKNLGFGKVYEASSGYDGIKIFQKENPDLVFLDMKMPRMNGLETLKIILSLNPKAKVILITAFEKSDSEVSDAISLGASDYLEKPVHRKKLLRIVENLSRKDNGWEGPTSIDHALSKIERIQEASGEEEEEKADENFLVFEFNSSEEFNDFSLEISKLKNVRIVNLQTLNDRFVVTVSVYPKTFSRII